ncbi:6-phosphogluconate dehydrogenase, NADP-binding protein [Corchorus olitorius]|uniref:6-phosphogluconate dehydrogenase, NADP-binding protein n=1 Tax=Corchorus olitorius TaxID=93759 RepID=A0A1R3H7F8_9ROSI|nr:6-phosphogluconate dehydrogenase, NADP-binding protein [Corchorus olitorius]
MEQKRLEEDAFVYNWLQQQLKLSPAYKKMLEIGACMELKAKSGELMDDKDTEFADISFEELLAQEKKDSFWTFASLASDASSQGINLLLRKSLQTVMSHLPCLPTLKVQCIDVACGKNGAASGMGPGKGYVDVSTVDVSTSKLINEHIKATGALFLEAPVSGSKKPAEDGQLIFLTAGDKSLYDSVAALLDIMGKVVSQGAISAPMYSLKGPSMVKSLYPTAFPLKHQQKDLRLALGLAESVSQSTPIAAAANELYKVAKSYGLSDEDFSAVIEALKAKSQD